MKSNYPIVPLEQTDLMKLIPLMTLTKLAKIALKSGTTPDVFSDAAIDAGYTGAGINSALREAGHRARRTRSDKGLTIKRKIQKLIDQARALEARLAQEDSSPGGDEPKGDALRT